MTASANATIVTDDLHSIVDSHGYVWSINQGQVAVNGKVDTTTANVVALTYVNGVVWQENASGLWWSATGEGSSWSPTYGTSTNPIQSTVTVIATTLSIPNNALDNTSYDLVGPGNYAGKLDFAHNDLVNNISVSGVAIVGDIQVSGVVEVQSINVSGGTLGAVVSQGGTLVLHGGTIATGDFSMTGLLDLQGTLAVNVFGGDFTLDDVTGNGVIEQLGEEDKSVIQGAVGSGIKLILDGGSMTFNDFSQFQGTLDAGIFGATLFADVDATGASLDAPTGLMTLFGGNQTLGTLHLATNMLQPVLSEMDLNGVQTLDIIGQYGSMVSGNYALSSDGRDFAFTALPPPTPPTPPAPPSPPTPPAPPNGPYVQLTDETTGISSTPAMTAYSGPVAGLQEQFMDLSPDNLNITAMSPNVFIHSGAGMDGLTVTSGDNILDGSTGSNFLTGGTGDDTFYLDDRNPSSAIFSTIVNFHSGDSATVWGVDQSDFNMVVLDNQGAAGYTGADLLFQRAGQPNTSFVLAGYNSADLSNGTLKMSYGRTADLPGLPGSDYLTVHAS